jgi:glutamate---cysteine ligase / carboxylate-amine ligase
MQHEPPSADALQAAFDHVTEFTVGIEEELLLLDPDTLELVPRAPELLSRLEDDQRFKFELPASQIEIVTPPCAGAMDAAAALMAARRDLAATAGGDVLLAGAGVSPLGSGRGELVALPQYERTIRDYRPIIEWQLVCALQVHVAVPGAERALAVYNHVRTYLPWLAALAANGVFYEGRDSGLASVRPLISDLLPRQGIPPALESWQQFADALEWGARSGAVPDPGTWWFELRPHPRFGTLEFRVPDTQSIVAEAAAIASVIHALVVWLARRYDAGDALPVAASWRLEQNRWLACRDGIKGELLDPHTGERSTARDLLMGLIEQLQSTAVELGTVQSLERAASMAERNGAINQREAARNGGARAVAWWLTERFLERWSG